VYNVGWENIVVGYRDYGFPFMLFGLFGDGECQHSIYIVVECSYFVFIQMVRWEMYDSVGAWYFTEI